MKTKHTAMIAALLAALLLGGAGDVLALGPGTTLLAAIDDSSIHATSDPHVFALRDARGRAGQIGTLTGNDDLFILPESMNLIPNPDMYDGGGDGVADNWSVSGDSGTPSKTTVEHGSGWAQRISYVSASDSNKTIIFSTSIISGSSISPGDDFIASINVYGASTGVNINLHLWAFSGTSAIGFKNVAVSSVSTLPKRFSATYENLPNNTTGLRVLVYVTGIDTGDSLNLYLGGASLVEGPLARECSGNGNSGCYWSGATDNSYSIHPPETMYVTGVETARAIELWWTPELDSDANQIVTLVRDSSNLFFVFVTGDTFTLNVGGYPITVDQAFDPGDALHIVARWDNGVQLSVNGKTNTSQSGDRGDALHTVDLCHSNGSDQCNGELSAVRFYNTVSDANVDTLYNSGAGLTVDEVADIREFVQGEEGAFMVDPVISYGEGGTIVAVMSVASVLLLIVAVGVANWLR